MWKHLMDTKLNAKFLILSKKIPKNAQIFFHNYNIFLTSIEFSFKHKKVLKKSDL